MVQKEVKRKNETVLFN